jgi:hypothetical protein
MKSRCGFPARAGSAGGQDARYMEHDSPYGELALTADGQIVHSLDWQFGTAAALENVMRLTAPNPVKR